MFKGPTRYAIPIYQRGYSWDKTDVDRFLEDLEIAHGSNDKHNHFFGFMITLKDTTNNSFEEFVDGQQRMTTAMLFLLCARNLFYRHNTDNLEQVNRYIEQLENYIFSSIDTKNLKHSMPRLTLSDLNQEFFYELVMNSQTPNTLLTKYAAISKTNQNLAAAYRLIYSWINKRFNATLEDFQKIYKFVVTLLNKFTIYKNTHHDRQQAQKIFDLVNHRGRELEVSDLIKHYLFSEMSNDANDPQIVKHNSLWTKLTQNVTNQITSFDLTLFLHYYLILSEGYSSYGIKPEKKRVYETIENLVDQARTPHTIVREIFDWSEIFVKLHAPDQFDEFDDYHNVIWHLEKMKMLRLKHAYPAILAAYKQYWEQGNADTFEKILAIILKYHIRVKIIMDKNTTHWERAINETLVYNILHGKTLDNILDELLHHAYYPSNTIVRNALEERCLTTPGAVMTVLEEIERAHTKIENWTPREIEHIMPKKLSDDWKSYIAQHNSIDTRDPKSARDKIDIFNDKYINYIGNQTLLEASANKLNSNKSFDEKLSLYADSKYHITQNLKKFSKWDKAAITKRQTELGEQLVDSIDLEKFMDEL